MAVEGVEMGKAVRGEVVWADHQNKPDVAVNIVRRWYDQDGVDAIFGIGNSGIERGRGAMTALSAWYGLKVSRGLYA
jgi:branched-chain amino acid transport system substrate-binding protein